MSASAEAAPRVVVVGAGVLGLASALRLAQAGARVTVLEAEPDRPNASRVAAGMIAPAAEVAEDPALAPLAADLAAARDDWDDLAAETGIALHACGTRLADGGAHPSDALLDAPAALDALASAVVRAGASVRRGRVRADAHGLLADGERLAPDAVVLALGAVGRDPRLASELAHLQPIKGQLLRWAARGGEPSMLRAPGLYLAVTPQGVVAGATMEPGRDDLEPDPAQVEPLRRAALANRPQLAGREPQVGVGVRAATPDRLPMAGASARPGVWLATGARRNGWLWAPPVAAIVAAQVLGRPLPLPLARLAERLNPRRFDEETR